MEHNNNNNEFEHFLRDSIADFIMIPQRKVWYGIYNHLHPEKKWPSIAVCFFILVSIMHIGISNNKNINTDVQQAKNEMLNKQNLFAQQIKKDNAVQPIANITTARIVEQTIETSTASNEINNAIDNPRNIDWDYNYGFTSFTKSETKPTLNIAVENSIATENDLTHITEKVIENVTENNVAKVENTNTAKEAINSANVLETFVTKSNTENKIATAEKKAEQTLENNFSSYNTLVKLPKRKTKSEISYYITPSIGYRVLEQNDALKISGTSANTAAITNNYGTTENPLEDKKAFNFEIGAAISRNISKKIKLSAGVQVNYTNYISKATSLSHPTQSTIAQRGASASYVNMDYSSNPGKISLNKTTLQIAVPVGITHTILGNENIKWNVAATIQPALVIAGSGYVLSTDKKYYVAEKDLLNRFNVSAAAETYLSIKTGKGIMLNVGPQFRYQLTSTYKKNYNFSENLYNIGLKIGVTTTL
jgi:hypothetical protein